VPLTRIVRVASSGSIDGAVNSVPSRGSSTCFASSRSCGAIAEGSASFSATWRVSRSTARIPSTWFSSSVNRAIDCALPTRTSSRLAASSSMRRLRAASAAGVCCS